MDNSKCVVLVPVARSIELETSQALTQLMDRGYPVRQMVGGSQIDLVRSMMASDAMRDGFEETMWIDADVVFDPNDVEKIRGHNLPMCVGLYPKKIGSQFACTFKVGTGALTFGKGGGLTEIAYPGMGFTHVRREVYDGIEKACNLPKCRGAYEADKTIVPYFIPLTVERETDHVYLSEDYAFAHRALIAGYPTIADTSIRLGHVHRHVKTWDDFVEAKTYESMQVGFGE